MTFKVGQLVRFKPELYTDGIFIITSEWGITDVYKYSVKPVGDEHLGKMTYVRESEIEPLQDPNELLKEIL